MIQGIAGCTNLAPVAVKTLSSRQGKLLQKFRQEVDLMKKFSHPNIVTLLGEFDFNQQYIYSGWRISLE